MSRQALAITTLMAFLTSSAVASAQYYRDPVNPRRYLEEPRTRLPGEKRLSDAQFEVPRSTVNVSGFFLDRRRDRSIFLDPNFGVLAGITSPSDFANFSIQRNRFIRPKSDYINELVKLPTDHYPTAAPTKAPWTVEEVKEALAQRSVIKSALASENWQFDQSDERLEKTRADSKKLSAEGMALFRAALSDDRENRKDIRERMRLFNQACVKFESAQQLMPHDPSNYIAATIVEREKKNLSTALVRMMQGLSRLESLTDLDFGREDFFVDERDWSRRLDDVNVLAKNANLPEPYLMLALYAYLNGDRSLARSSTEEALRRYEKKADSPSNSSFEALEFEKRIDQSKKLLAMLDAKAKPADDNDPSLPTNRDEDR